MSKEAINYKLSNKNLDFNQMSLHELNKLPSFNGVYNFQISETSFSILNILNDDSSAVKHFWRGSHELEELDIWYKISKKEGTFIDVGAHTGLYTITFLKANSKNNIICFEPYFMNLSRLITNMRLNGFTKNVTTILGAASNFDGQFKFKITTERSYMGQGGRLSKEGIDTRVYRLDSLFHKINKKIEGIKIDTEGEDLQVLQGAENLIKEHKPKIIIEVREENKVSIINLLKKNGYKIFHTKHMDNEFNFDQYKIENVINLFATL